ncbi:hypothetical protein GCM10027073_36150 [Streptomyces chlorus]
MVGHDVLPGWKPSQFGDQDLDDEAASGFQVSRGVAETDHLLRLRRQIQDRVEEQVGDGERPVHPRRREIADRDVDRVTAWLGTQPGNHRLRQVDAVDLDSALCQWQRDAPRPDAQLKGPATVGQARQKVDRLVDDARLEHLP